MKKSFITLVAFIALVMGSMIATAQSASAHTPSLSADCSGLVLDATNYDAGKANKYSYQVGTDAPVSGTFGSSFHKVVSIPNDGTVYTVVAHIEAYDGSYAADLNKSVGPCGDSTKVTLCHATGSNSNPFVEITVSAAGAYNGHLGNGHQNGEDIIPPFVYQGNTYQQNWDAAGQATFNNGCQVPVVTPPPPPNVTCNNTASNPLTGTYANVDVAPGDSCYIDGGTIHGTVTGDNPCTVSVIDSTVWGDIDVHGSTCNVVVGAKGCRYDPLVRGNIFAVGGHNVAICKTHTLGHVLVKGNDGRLTFRNNRTNGEFRVANNLRYVHHAGDGRHKNVGVIRFYANNSNTNVVKHNAGRRVFTHGNHPAV